LNDDLSKIEKNIKDLEVNDFYTEKMAREKLQMAKKGDQIYFLTKKG